VQLFVCIHVHSHSFNNELACTLIVINQFLINLSCKTNKQNTKNLKVIGYMYLCFILVDFIHSSHYLLKISTWISSLKKKIRPIDLTCWWYCFSLDTRSKILSVICLIFILQKSWHILANNRNVPSRIHHQLYCINEHRKYQNRIFKQ